VVIAHQPATTAEPVLTRPPMTTPEATPARSAPPARVRSAHELVLVEEPLRTWTVFKIAALLAITALTAAMATAILFGGALFAASTIR
jgi:hypothetical protein